MSEKSQIWVLEDQDSQLFVYEEILGEQFELQFFKTTEAFYSAFETQKQKPSLALIDLALEGENFLDFLKCPKKKILKSFPWLVVSCVSDPQALHFCLNSGAVDYLVKPFHESELLVKVARLIADFKSPIAVDHLTNSIRNPEGIMSNLTPKEMRIFRILNQAFETPIPKQRIVDDIWPNTNVGSRTLDVHITNIRRKISRLGVYIQWEMPDMYKLVPHTTTPFSLNKT